MLTANKWYLRYNLMSLPDCESPTILYSLTNASYSTRSRMFQCRILEHTDMLSKCGAQMLCKRRDTNIRTLTKSHLCSEMFSQFV
jgi:hypothetical protein